MPYIVSKACTNRSINIVLYSVLSTIIPVFFFLCACNIISINFVEINEHL